MREVLNYIVLWFLNPLFLWILLVFIGNKLRKKNESINLFNRQIKQPSLIHKQVLPYSILIGIILSLVFLVFDYTFSFNFIMIYTTLVVLYTFTYELNKISILYTFGLAIILYYFITQQHLIIIDQSEYYSSVILLLVFLLMIEATMYLLSKPHQFRIKGTKGQLNHQFQKIMIVPLFINIPSDLMIDLGLSFLVSAENETTLLFLPLLIGAEEKMKQLKDLSVMRKKAYGIYAIGLVLLFGLLLPYELRLTLIMFAIVLRIALDLFIYFKIDESKGSHPLEILYIEPNSLADYFKLEIGHIITHIDTIKVDSKEELKTLLLIHEGDLEMNLQNNLGEEIKITVKSFQNDSELGIIIPGKPEVI